MKMCMKIKIIFIFLMVMHNCSYTMNNPKDFENIKDIQTTCLSLLKRLDQQPELSHPGCIHDADRCKALPANATLSQVIEKVCDDIKEQLGPEAGWHISAVSSLGQKRVLLSSGFYMGDGLAKQLYSGYDTMECPLDEFKKEFKKVLARIQVGWKCTSSTSKQYTDVSRLPCPPSYDKELSEWSLLIKRKKIKDEAHVLSNLNHLLGFAKTSLCDDRWKRTSEYEQYYYLWVKTESFIPLCAALQLKVKF